jgi:hypothetical protein
LKNKIYELLLIGFPKKDTQLFRIASYFCELRRKLFCYPVVIRGIFSSLIDYWRNYVNLDYFPQPAYAHRYDGLGTHIIGWRRYANSHRPA